MKLIKSFALILCVSAFAFGCACNKSACCADTPACGMKCCADGKTDCAHCPTCSAKK